MKSSGKAKALLFLVIAVVLVFGGLSALIVIQGNRLDGLKRAIADLEEERVALKFKITGRAGGKLSVRLRFYDRDGLEAGKLDAELAGSSLYIDFAVVKAEGSYLAFPQAAFTDELAAAKGLPLYAAYDRGGFPAIFGKAGLGAAERLAFRKLFQAVKRGDGGGERFGSAVHDVAEIASFDVGTVYRIVSRAKGGLEVLED